MVTNAGGRGRSFGTATGRCPTAGGRCYGFGLSFMVPLSVTSSGDMAVTWRPPKGAVGRRPGRLQRLLTGLGNAQSLFVRKGLRAAIGHL